MCIFGLLPKKKTKNKKNLFREGETRSEINIIPGARAIKVLHSAYLFQA